MNGAPITRSANMHDELTRALDAVRTAAASVDALAAVLRAADELNGVAARMIASLSQNDAIEKTTGLAPETMVRLEGRKMPWDAREMCAAAETLRRMPRLADALSCGVVTWSQARAIVRAMRPLDTDGVGDVDELIATNARALSDAEPETLVELVEDAVARRRGDLMLRREDRIIETSFLALQPRLGGGGILYGQADAERFASIAEAIDAAAEPLTAAEEPMSRAQQRLDALAHICETALAGGGRMRPRPRMVVTVDAAELADVGRGRGARILWRLAGRPAVVTPLATEVLACDAEITPVIVEHGRPVAVGRTGQTIPTKTRTALMARDGGCRFPGCGMPVSWCDAHHITHRVEGGDASIDNLVLLCRRCHRRVHRYRWRIRLDPDATVRFTYRARTFVTHPRARPPRC